MLLLKIDPVSWVSMYIIWLVITVQIDDTLLFYVLNIFGMVLLFLYRGYGFGIEIIIFNILLLIIKFSFGEFNANDRFVRIMTGSLLVFFTISISNLFISLLFKDIVIFGNNFELSIKQSIINAVIFALICFIITRKDKRLQYKLKI